MKANLYEAKTQLSRLVDRALTGEEVVICRAGKPLVRLVPVAAAKPRRIGQFAGMHVPDEAMAPLTDEEIDLFYK